MTIRWDDEEATPFDDCPICHSDETVYATGSLNSKILIVGEFPGVEEVKRGIPMVGNMGTVLRLELAKAGMDVQAARRCNLWHHAPNEKRECLDHGASLVMKEAAGKKLILLMGSEVIKYFLNKSVLDVSGMWIDPPLFLGKRVMACVNPAWVFTGGVGEVRLALTRFVRAAEALELL